MLKASLPRPQPPDGTALALKRYLEVAGQPVATESCSALEKGQICTLVGLSASVIENTSKDLHRRSPSYSMEATSVFALLQGRDPYHLS